MVVLTKEEDILKNNVEKLKKLQAELKEYWDKCWHVENDDDFHIPENFNDYMALIRDDLLQYINWNEIKYMYVSKLNNNFTEMYNNSSAIPSNVNVPHFNYQLERSNILRRLISIRNVPLTFPRLNELIREPYIYNRIDKYMRAVSKCAWVNISVTLETIQKIDENSEEMVALYKRFSIGRVTGYTSIGADDSKTNARDDGQKLMRRSTTYSMAQDPHTEASTSVLMSPPFGAEGSLPVRLRTMPFLADFAKAADEEDYDDVIRNVEVIIEIEEGEEVEMNLADTPAAADYPDYLKVEDSGLVDEVGVDGSENQVEEDEAFEVAEEVEVDTSDA